MPTQEFNCPNCGAPLDYSGSGATMRCPYCETSVVVPAEMRPQPAQPPRPQYIPPPQPIQVRPSVVVLGKPETITPTGGRGMGCLVGIIVAVVIVVAGIGLAASLLITNNTTKMVSKALEPVIVGPTAIPLATQVPEPTEVPTPTPEPTAFAQLVTTFGSQGTGQGLLNNAQYIAVDGSGTVYVADYQDGRIQAFDADGKYLRGWQVGDANTIIYGMTITHEGILYVAFKGDIYRYNGSKGKPLDKLSYANGKEFGDLVTLADGGVLGVWYQGRWGMITSLEGHREDLVWFDADGKTVRTLKSAISGQTDSLALDVSVAVDGLGTVYALSSYDGAVFKYSSDGKFIDRFDFQGNNNQEGRCIAVDGQGRVYVGGGDQVSIFTAEGKFIRAFETREQVYKMAFAPAGDLYIVSGDSVSKYRLGELP